MADEIESGEASGVTRPWWLWLLIVVLVLLLLFFLRGCFGDGSTEPDEIVEPAETAPGVEAAAEVESPGAAESEQQPAALEPPPPAGPGAAGLGLSPDSVAGRLADFLSHPESTFPRSFSLDKTRFPFNSAKLNPEGHSQLDKIAEVLLAYPEASFEIQGHIDGTEAEEYPHAADGETITLSTIRARCIYRKLIERGVESERMQFQGFGSTRPVASDDTEDGRLQNRRIELVFTER